MWPRCTWGEAFGNKKQSALTQQEERSIHIYYDLSEQLEGCLESSQLDKLGFCVEKNNIFVSHLKKNNKKAFCVFLC